MEFITLSFAVLFVFIWMFCWRAITPVRYDTGLYHIQLINWLSNYPIIIGLGNFHERFAFPQSYFFYLTYLENAYRVIGGFYIASYLLIANILFEWLLGIRNIVLKASFLPVNFFRALLIFPITLFHCYDSWIITASPDTAIFLLELIMTVWFIDLLGTPSHEIKFSKSLESFSFIIVCLVGLTFKASFIVFGIAMLIITCLNKSLRFNWLSLFCLFLFIFLPFFLRNILISGYLFFPLAHPSFPVDWRIPDSIRYSNLDCVSNFAKDFSCQTMALFDFSWVKTWLKFNLRYCSSFLLCPPAIILIGLVFGAKRILNKTTALFIFPATASLLITFLFAPDSRFFASSPWIIGLTLFSITLAEYASFLNSSRLRWYILLTVVLYVFMTTRSALSIAHVELRLPSGKQYKQIKLGLDTNILQIVAGDQCWATSLPCTPGTLEGLEFRDGKHVESGFVRRTLK